MDDLNDHLARIEAVHDVFTDGLLLNGSGKVLDSLEIDVCFKKRDLDFLHRLPDIAFGQTSLASELFEDSLQFFCKALKCHL